MDTKEYIATNKITVTGEPLTYPYGEAPANEPDSGWRFSAEMQDQAYLNELTHCEVYSVNTLANLPARNPGLFTISYWPGAQTSKRPAYLYPSASLNKALASE